MRQTQNNRKKAWRAVRFCMTVLVFILAFGHTGVHNSHSGVLVVSALTTQEQIDQAEKEKKELQDKQKENKGDLKDLKGQQKSLKEELEDMNAEMVSVIDNIEDIESQMRTKEQEIAETQAALEEARIREDDQYESMVSKVRYMYENKEKNYLNVLVKEQSLSSMLNLADYIEKVAAYDRKVMNDYVNNRIAIEENEARLKQEMKDLEELRALARAEQEKLTALIEKTEKKIAQYADQISDAEKKAKEYEEELAKAEADLKVLKKKLAEEIAKSQEAANSTWRDISQVTFADGDRKLLANIIYCEAGGESYAGKLAVGSVVINRVLSSKYPDTVYGVIYQKSQFSPVASGRLALALAQDRATEQCYKAADEAMAGMTNVGQCVYFRRPVAGLVGINIGNHVFY